MTDLADFLLARIADDEAVARAATTGPWRWVGDREKDEADLWGPPDGGDAYARPVITASGMHTEGYIYVSQPDADHIARWDPARVLAECEAKRRIVEEATWGGDCQGHPGSYQPHGDYGPGYCRDFSDNQYLRLLALPYADHPDWREEWRP